MTKFEPYKRAAKHFGPIVFRHVFLLVNGIIFSVVGLLFVFKNAESAIIIGAVFLFNILLGIIQDTRAQIALERLQLLTAIRITRINTDGSESAVLMEEIVKGDHLRVKLGDQIPCDGVLLSAEGLEVSEALLTGESDSFSRQTGDKVDAGDIVTSGSAVLEVQKLFAESRIARMTEAAKKYTASPSPIQIATNIVIKWSGYALIFIIVFVVTRGIVVGEPNVDMVMNIGAIASSIVPQGLVVVTTLLFALGAASYSNRHVLFQEINATEKLGRIKNLCMDKTGTLTGNMLLVEQMHIPDSVSKDDVHSLVATYLRGSKESSQTITAIQKYLDGNDGAEEVLESLPFSSWRQYGGVKMLRKDKKEAVILIGAPDVLLPFVRSDEEQAWLNGILTMYAHQGKRLVCVVRSAASTIPKTLAEKNLSVAAVFAFQSNFREGAEKAVAFFQNRGVKIRILSGDSPDTVSAIAKIVGVNATDAIIIGAEMKSWSDADFEKQVHKYTIFARILPEQKVKIIEAFKKDGFTAMVGDGANDALAIKKSDLGIAMFDGAPATRALAAVVLMENSFADLPGGVELADNFIQNIKIFAGVFINQSLVGLALFIFVSLFGYAYPLTPLNITLINYFTIGIPSLLLSYWSISPSGKILPATTESFLSQVMPFVLWSSLIEGIAAVTVFLASPVYLKLALSNTLVILAFSVSGFIFFMFGPKVYRGILTKAEQWHIAALALFEIALAIFIFKIPFLIFFFNITLPLPEFTTVLQAISILLVFGVFQYMLARYFLKKRD